MGKIIFHILLILSVSVFDLNGAQAEGYTIKGRVTDTNGNPLVGAAVIIDGTYNGVQTDSDGNYLLTGLKGGDCLVRYSFIGYETITRSLILNGDAFLDVQLSPMAVITDEVVISATRAGRQTPMAYSNVTGDILEKRNSGQDIPYLSESDPFVCRDFRGWQWCRLYKPENPGYRRQQDQCYYRRHSSERSRITAGFLG